MRKFYKPILLACLCLWSADLRSQGFREVARESGIDTKVNADFLMGGGAAFFDYDNDGDLDIYATRGNDRDALFQNDGNGNFTEVGEAAGLLEGYYTMGVTTGDIDNDGDRDIFVATWGLKDGNQQVERFTRNLLYLNNGDGTFTEVGEENGFANHKAWSASASFGDVNLDGFLDLYVVNYVRDHGPISLNVDGSVSSFSPDCFTNFLFINQGDGTFREEYIDYFENNDTGCGLAVAFTDYNQDANPDLLVANDFGWWAEPNRLYSNEYPNGEMLDVSSESGANIPMFGMGIAVGDYDEDQDLDYYITNIRGNSLMRNEDGNFTDVASVLNIENTYTNDLFTTGWGTVFMDYDNDSYLDLAVVNGFVAAEPVVITAKEDRDKMYKNNGDGSFEDVSESIGFNSPELSRSVIYGDIDSDGDLDVFVNVLDAFESVDPHMLLYKNESSAENNWLAVKLEGVESNRDAFGAKVSIHFEGRTLIRELNGGSSFASQNSSTIHFGIGEATSIDYVEVVWPGGRVQRVEEVVVNSEMKVLEDVTITSVEEEPLLKHLDTGINVFPNPNSGEIMHLQFDLPTMTNLEIQLLSADGNVRDQLYQAKNAVGPQEFQFDIERSGSKGLYLVVIKTDLGIFTKKLLLE